MPIWFSDPYAPIEPALARMAEELAKAWLDKHAAKQGDDQ
jgi:hypothetical protein